MKESAGFGATAATEINEREVFPSAWRMAGRCSAKIAASVRVG